MSKENLSTINGETENFKPFDDGSEPIAVEPLNDAPPQEPQAVEILVPEIPEDQFCEMMAGLFPVIGGVQAMFDPPPFAVWEEAPGFHTANPAFRALYRLAKRFPFLNFLIIAEYGWLGDAVLVAAFAGQVTMAMMQEARMRHPNREFANGPMRTRASNIKVAEEGIDLSGDETATAGLRPQRYDETRVPSA